MEQGKEDMRKERGVGEVKEQERQEKEVVDWKEDAGKRNGGKRREEGRKGEGK